MGQKTDFRCRFVTCDVRGENFTGYNWHRWNKAQTTEDWPTSEKVVIGT